MYSVSLWFIFVVACEAGMKFQCRDGSIVPFWRRGDCPTTTTTTTTTTSTTVNSTASTMDLEVQRVSSTSKPSVDESAELDLNTSHGNDGDEGLEEVEIGEHVPVDEDVHAGHLNNDPDLAGGQSELGVTDPSLPSGSTLENPIYSGRNLTLESFSPIGGQLVPDLISQETTAITTSTTSAYMESTTSTTITSTSSTTSTTTTTSTSTSTTTDSTTTTETVGLPTTTRSTQEETPMSTDQVPDGAAAVVSSAEGANGHNSSTASPGPELNSGGPKETGTKPKTTFNPPREIPNSTTGSSSSPNKLGNGKSKRIRKVYEADTCSIFMWF